MTGWAHAHLAAERTMTIGRNAVGYLTESLHGAGSPQAQRIQIVRGTKIDEKKARARHLAGIAKQGKVWQ